MPIFDAFIDWLQKLELIFNYRKYYNFKWVHLVETRFEGLALHWWVALMTHRESLRPPTLRFGFRWSRQWRRKICLLIIILKYLAVLSHFGKVLCSICRLLTFVCRNPQIQFWEIHLGLKEASLWLMLVCMELLLLIDVKSAASMRSLSSSFYAVSSHWWFWVTSSVFLELEDQQDQCLWWFNSLKSGKLSTIW